PRSSPHAQAPCRRQTIYPRPEFRNWKRSRPENAGALSFRRWVRPLTPGGLFPQREDTKMKKPSGLTIASWMFGIAILGGGCAGRAVGGRAGRGGGSAGPSGAGAAGPSATGSGGTTGTGGSSATGSGGTSTTGSGGTSTTGTGGTSTGSGGTSTTGTGGT